MFRLGWLRPNGAGPGEFQSLGIPAALARMSWVEGRNLVIGRRWADGRTARLPELARDLVQVRCDVLLTVGLSATRAAREVTPTVPIVFFGNFDPVATGLVASLGRPGGNLSGVLIAADGTLAAKKMELLKGALPRAKRIAFLSPEDPAMQSQVAEARQAAQAFGLELGVVTVRGKDNVAAFDALAAQRAQDRIASQIDKFFRGARIGELRVELPTTFGRTTRAIGLARPRSLVLRADEVIV